MLQIDAFSAVPFHGNQAAVVLLDARQARAVNAEIRQKIAAEMNLSETAFVEATENADSSCKHGRSDMSS